MIKIFEIFMDFLYPRHCVKCGKFIRLNSADKWYCDNCAPFEPVKNKRLVCERCGRITDHLGRCIMCNGLKTYYDKGYVLYEYANEFRAALIRFKFNNKTVYGKYFAEEMAHYAFENIKYDYDIICCVPLHRRRKAQRGYNQAEILTKKLSEHIAAEYKPVLLKIKNTKQQSSLPAKDRVHNIKNAFKCDYDLKGKSVLIIDDIVTTGNTINECCKALKRAGAERVDFFALAGAGTIAK